jgi:uncharacterized protein with NAD-binding domain and iron-sulfur cluster
VSTKGDRILKKVIIVGGGLAGLSAGIKLLEKRPDTQVTLYNMGHHMGGKIASHRDEDGYNIDHGFHAIQMNAQRLLGLMERAGVDRERDLVPDRGTYFYQEPGRMSGPDIPMDEAEMQAVANQMAFLGQHQETILTDPDIEKYDDISWTDWMLERGYDEELTKTRGFRFSIDALFNWPYEISTYINFVSIRLLGGIGGYYLTNGSYGEVIVDRLVDYFRKLGGRIEMYHKLTEVEHDGQRVTGLHFARPDYLFHDHGSEEWERSVQVLPGNVLIDDFDAAILTLPVDSFRELNSEDSLFWQGFPGIENLRSVSTLSWQMWTEEKVLPVDCCINTLDEPLPMVIDYKNLRDEYRNNDKIGSALEWVGQENSFEEVSDEEIKALTLECFLTIPGAKDPRDKGITHESFRRNGSNHKRYLLTDPGTLKFRPHKETHFENMFLAGDWIRNEVDVPTMEGTVCSGYAAVDALLED